jgi:hypothetical protein
MTFLLYKDKDTYVNGYLLHCSSSLLSTHSLIKILKIKLFVDRLLADGLLTEYIDCTSRLLDGNVGILKLFPKAGTQVCAWVSNQTQVVQ